MQSKEEEKSTTRKQGILCLIKIARLVGTWEVPMIYLMALHPPASFDEEVETTEGGGGCSSSISTVKGELVLVLVTFSILYFFLSQFNSLYIIFCVCFEKLKH